MTNVIAVSTRERISIRMAILAPPVLINGIGRPTGKRKVKANGQTVLPRAKAGWAAADAAVAIQASRGGMSEQWLPYPTPLSEAENLAVC